MTTDNPTIEDIRTIEEKMLVAAKEEHDRLENENAELLMIIATHEQTIERLTHEVLQADRIEKKIDKLLEREECSGCIVSLGDDEITNEMVGDA